MECVAFADMTPQGLNDLYQRLGGRSNPVPSLTTHDLSQ